MLLFLPPRRWSSVCPPSPCFVWWGSSKPRALARSAGTVWGGESLCLQSLHLSEYCVGHFKPQFWKVFHAGVQLQWNKNHLETTIRLESRDFSCYSTQEALKPQFWPGDITFPIIMAAALYLCPKLVSLSRYGFLHITFKWLNHMQLAQWE